MHPSRLVRVSLLVGAWITSLTALVGSDWRTIRAEDLVFFLFFPTGLFRALGLEGGREPEVLGWGIYLMLGVAILALGKRKTVFGSFAVLCVLLFVNVVGCHRMTLP